MPYVDPAIVQRRERRLLEFLERREGEHITQKVLSDIYEPAGLDVTTVSKVIKRLIDRGDLEVVEPSKGYEGNSYRVLRKEPMPQVREIVRGFGQQGVPANYRAGSTVKGATTHPQAEQESTRLLLNYISRHQGSRMSRREVGLVIGFKSSGAISTKLRQMQEEGLIDWESARRGFYKFYIPTQTDLPKGDPRNGEVRVVRPAQVEAAPKPEVREPEHEWQSEPPKAEPIENRVRTQSQEELFASLVDGFMWEFLKQYEVSQPGYGGATPAIALGEALKILREFSKFMETRADERN